jgi:hypothetical protein
VFLNFFSFFLFFFLCVKRYSSAVARLQQLCGLAAPLHMLKCLSQTTREICLTIAHHLTPGSDDYPLGADDLLPIVHFVVLKSGLDTLPAFLHIMVQQE